MLNNPPLIIAHRGASAVAPENTLIAFRRAIEIGVDGIEFDVTFTSDSIPVIFHDYDLRRIARISAPISKMSYRDIEKIDIGEWFNKRFPAKASNEFLSQRIPRLDEALQFFGSYAGKIYMEIKSQGEVSESQLEKILCITEASSLKENVVFKSFELSTLTKLRILHSQCKTAALFSPTVSLLRSRDRMLKLAKAFDVDEISLHHSLINKNLVANAKRDGFNVVVWTVNRPSWLVRACKLGIHAVITDDPLKFKQLKTKI